MKTVRLSLLVQQNSKNGYWGIHATDEEAGHAYATGHATDLHVAFERVEFLVRSQYQEPILIMTTAPFGDL